MTQEDREKLHQKVVELETLGLNWQRAMVVHGLIDLGIVEAIECAMPRCRHETREFIYEHPKQRARVLSIDHIKTVREGGSHRPENLRLAHLGCNSAAAMMSDEARNSQSKNMELMRRRQKYAKLAASRGVVMDMSDRSLEKFLDEDDWSWLNSTRQLQRRVYKINYDLMKGDALADYVTWNALALQDEVHEFLQEVQWKNWAKNRGQVNREEAVGELIDVAHFLGNLLVVLGVSDEEYEARYREKQARNAKRQEAPGGYDSIAKKCPHCKRELDKEGATFIRDGETVGNVTQVYCTGCKGRIGEST